MFIDRLVNAELWYAPVFGRRGGLSAHYNARSCRATDDITSWLTDERRSFERFYQMSRGALTIPHYAGN